MIYELRLYSVAPGRMADVNDRFAHHLPPLFQRHGVNCVGRWTALAGPNAPRFVYMLAYRDYAHREETWASFYQDDEWWRIRAATNAGHEMVERHDLFFLKPNPMWDAPGEPGATITGLHELVMQEIAPGQNSVANAFLKDTYLPLVREAGAQVLGLFDMAAGTSMQKMVFLLAWPDAAAWHTGRRWIDDHADLRAAQSSQREKTGTTCFLRSEINLLEVSPGVTIRSEFGRGSD
ncbi:NIPSNAP family protein [Burkholderia pseudomultivorans]|uniref:NIPSNAP family protein n=1 Tax=Burkholderia pseudomultivorans TaxID=1207504 RepID=UPI00287471E6|nr:NIPSNAP family protein [Burkholderia pseudomultivorans]MDS0859642.1 NIPSNAP family protein [Burkholderia pseudomultivorans]